MKSYGGSTILATLRRTEILWYNTWMALRPFTYVSYILLGLLSSGFSVSTAFAQQQRGIKLLEPIGNVREICVAGGPLAAFFMYFNALWPWLIGVGAGVAVLWAIIGALNIIMSGGDQTKRQEGIDYLLSALFGLGIILLAGVLLRMINPSFFVQGNVPEPPENC